MQVKMKLAVNIFYKQDVQDPASVACLNALGALGFSKISGVKIGKQIILDLDTESPQEAADLAQQAAKKLLANEITECFTVGLAP